MGLFQVQELSYFCSPNIDCDQVLNRQVGICGLFNQHPRLEQKMNVSRTRVIVGKIEEGDYENYSMGKMRLQAELINSAVIILETAKAQQLRQILVARPALARDCTAWNQMQDSQ